MDKVTRPSLVGRLLAAAYPNGIPADQVENSVRITAVLGLVAEAVATGRPFGGIPLSLLADASQPARFDVEPVVEDVEDVADEPVPFVPAVPAETKSRSKYARKDTDYDDLPVGILTDPMVGAVAGLHANAVACRRAKTGTAAANAGGGHVDNAVLFRRLVQVWGAERCEAWLSRWPKAEELYGVEIRRTISGEAAPLKLKPAPWTRPKPETEPETEPEPEPEPAKPAPVTPPLCAPVKRPDDILANGTRRGARSLPRLAMPAPPAIPASRQAELDAIQKAIAEGKVTRVPSRYVEPETRPAAPRRAGL